MPPLTIDQIREFDKRYAAIHEAAHVVVGTINDRLKMSCHIEECITDDPVSNKTWIGQAQVKFGADKDSFPAMAVAGCTAAWLEDDPELSASDCCEYANDVDDNSISPTDRAMFPAEDNEQLAAFETALTILRKHKAFFDWLVAQLLSNESHGVTDGTVDDYVRENKLLAPTD